VAVLVFNKFLPLFILPFGMVCALVVLAVVRKKRWPAVLALVVLYGASIPLVSNLLLGWLEAHYPAIPVAEAGPADAVVVLGGILGPQVAKDAGMNWAESVERFQAGVALVQAGRADRLYFSGAPRRALGQQTTEGEELRRQAIALGVAPDKIVVTPFVDNTAMEASTIAALLKAESRKRVILVTTAWHLPRAAMQFRRAGVEFIPFPVDFQVDPMRRIGVMDFVPNAGSWQGTETAIRECYGYAFYAIFRRPAAPAQ